MTKFENIDFVPTRRNTGVMATIKFENGYSASIVCHDHSYGGPDGLFEIAVINRHGELDYTTPVTSDVLGYLLPHDVEEILAEIEALPAA